MRALSFCKHRETKFFLSKVITNADYFISYTCVLCFLLVLKLSTIPTAHTMQSDCLREKIIERHACETLIKNVHAKNDCRLKGKTTKTYFLQTHTWNNSRKASDLHETPPGIMKNHSSSSLAKERFVSHEMNFHLTTSQNTYEMPTVYFRI